MAAKKTEKKSTKGNDFKEFSFKGEHFEYSGRIYPDRQREAGKLTITPISLCLDGVFNIKGCSFYETDKNMWVGGPQYKSGDQYNDYLYLDKELNQDMDNLAEAIKEAMD